MSDVEQIREEHLRIMSETVRKIRQSGIVFKNGRPVGRRRDAEQENTDEHVGQS